MTIVPGHWDWTTVGQAGRLQLGRQRAPRYHSGPNMKPYLRVANVFEDRIDLTDVKEMHFETAEFERYRLHPGDVLLNEGQSPEWLGRPAIYSGQREELAFTNSLIRFQAGPGVEPRWALAVFRHHMHSGRFTRESRITTNIAHLSIGRLRAVEFPVPPLDEQRRIVDLLEDHLSRLDAAEGYLRAAERRAKAWHRQVVDRLVWGPDFSTKSVGSVLREPMRNGRSDRAAQNSEAGVRALTLTAVTKNAFTNAHTKLTVTTPERATGVWLEPGDVFVQRSNTPELVGTTARYDGPSEWAIFPDLLIRLRPDESVIDGRFLTAALRSFRGHHQLRSKAKGLAGSMPKIDQATIAAAQVPAPPLDVQRRIVESVASADAALAAMRKEVATATARSRALRRALLSAAFSGRLIGSDVDLSAAEEMIGA